MLAFNQKLFFYFDKVIILSSDDENDTINQTCSSRNGISEADILILGDEKGLLNDEIITYYMKLLCLTLIGSDNKPLAFCFDTNFYKKLEENKHENALKWSPDLLKYKYALVPIFTNSCTPGINNIGHWSLIIVDMENSSIYYYDSLSFVQGDKCINHMKKFLTLKYENKNDASKSSFREWVSGSMPNIPKQKNEFDCGVFMCQFAKSVVNGQRIAELSFLSSIKELREEMIVEIKEKKIKKK